MTFSLALLLAAAGFLGGTINAVAGGATLFTFPAMLFAGLPPIIANASSSVALTPGHLFAVLAERDKLPSQRFELCIAICLAAIGGLAGAFLLLWTTEKTFTQIVPLLIGVATLIFAFGKRLQNTVKQHFGTSHDTPLIRLCLLAPVSVYGGYFGAGMGVVLMAAFAVTSSWSVRTANATKNLLGAVSNWAAIAAFMTYSMISWPETIAMLSGAVLGGLTGARLLKSLSTETIRAVVVTAGSLLTVIYTWKYWL